MGWRPKNSLSNPLGKGAVPLLPLSRPLGKAVVSPGPLMVEDAATRTDFRVPCQAALVGANN